MDNQSEAKATYNLSGRVCIVTGAGGGIGTAIVARLRSFGAKLVLADLQFPDAASGATYEGGQVLRVRADISRAADVVALFDRAEKTFGGVDVVVNNAATASYGTLGEADEEEFDRVFAINAKGAFLMMRECARRVRNGGAVVNIASSLLRFPLEALGIYAASKGASEQFAAVAAIELGKRGISVNCVLPGPTAPGMFASAPKEIQDAAAAKSPFSRIAVPGDIANIVAFLAAKESAWLSGQSILVNGAAAM